MTTPRSPRVSRAMILPFVARGRGAAIAASERPCPATEDLPLQAGPGPAAQRRGAKGADGGERTEAALRVPAHLRPVGAEHLGEHGLGIGLRARIGVLQAAQPGLGPGDEGLVWG